MTRLPARPAPVLLPSYSLTGDLLSYDRCAYQYRLFTRTGVRQSHPVQQWYGNFLHMGMRRAYDLWRNDGEEPKGFLWSDPLMPPFEDLVEHITRRLRALGLFRPASMGEIAEQRLVRAIRVLGPLIFPLIKEAEVRLAALRQEASTEHEPETIYQITGVVDVLASTPFAVAADNPLVAEVLRRAGEVPGGEELEVILDYKGIARADIEDMLETAQRQILTYAWLRNRRVGRSVVTAGAVVFVNDLLDCDGDPNVDPTPAELEHLLHAAIEPVVVTTDSPEEAAQFFDKRVREIEARQALEGTAPLAEIWVPRPHHATCIACDARYHCPESDVEKPDGAGAFAPDAP